MALSYVSSCRKDSSTPSQLLFLSSLHEVSYLALSIVIYPSFHLNCFSAFTHIPVKVHLLSNLPDTDESFAPTPAKKKSPLLNFFSVLLFIF